MIKGGSSHTGFPSMPWLHSFFISHKAASFMPNDIHQRQEVSLILAAFASTLDDK